MRTAETIEQAKEQHVTQSSDGSKTKKQRNPRSLANLRPWQPGQSGNPGGKPKHDVGREIARAILENNQEAIYSGLAAALIKGNAYVFKELCERGYGKVPDKLDVSVNSDVVERLMAARKRK